ncbi:DUF1648 domain-containing protein [Flavobacterium sp. SM15]|uniref:DUF1648 domain-containing protein n=1 Tax=Flavobacterium sp. SM15 TaxID=2908005 RepID=UPI001EDA0D9B|nr:DUF1648 domain-containing protein [Flavobacterium sp. SM15]MCG2612275.1 DUF1648 domain-containing protein [Flavobacterium sp. SM15]
MEERPKLKIPLKPFDKIVEALGWAALIGIWILTLSNYTELPQTIPTHFDGSGQADGYGSKMNLLALPLISSVIFIVLTALSFFPHLHNYPAGITQENAEKQYQTSTRMFRFLKLIILIIFGLIVYMTLKTINGTADGLGTWFLPLVLGLIFIPIFYFLTQMVKNS